MKRLFIVTLIAVMGFSTGIVANASADSIQGKSAVGVNLMYVMPGDSDISDLDISLPLDNAIGYGLNYTYGVAKDWALEVSLDRSSHDVDVDVLGLSVNFGEASMTTLGVTGQYRPEIASMELSPYVGLGLGYSFVSADLSSVWEDACILFYGYPCSLDVDNAFALYINAGTDYFVSDNIALSFEGRYTISNASSTYKETYEDIFGDVWTDTYSFDLSLDRFDIRAGAKYYF